MHTLLSRLRRFRPDALIVALVLGLLLAQTLGLLHRIDHRVRSVTAASLVSTAGSVANKPVAPGGVLKALFGDHADNLTCELYDQLAHGDALWHTAGIAWPEIFVPAPVGVHVAWHIAPQAAGFLARGPPQLS